MQIYANFFETLRSRVDIVDIVSKHVDLKRKNKEYIGLCPFHSEKTPSFKVNKLRGFYHCFGCGAHGDVISFLSKTTGLSYKDSAYKLAYENGVEVPKLTKQQIEQSDEENKILEVLEITNRFYKQSMSADVVKYLNNRGIDSNDIKNYEIGFSASNQTKNYLQKLDISLNMIAAAGIISKSESGVLYEVFRNRITIPIKNKYGKIIGFGCRSIDDSLPKYINSPETVVFKKQNVLYGENVATSESYKKNFCIVVEGYFDCISLHKNGFVNAVATLGTAISEKHISNMWKICEEIVICMDGDNAGVRATSKLINDYLPIISSEKSIGFVILDGCDPDEYVRKFGAVEFQKKIDQRLTMSEVMWYLSVNNKQFRTAEDYSKLEHSLRSMAEKLDDKSLRYNYNRFFKQKIWDLHSSSFQSTSNIRLKSKKNYGNVLQKSFLESNFSQSKKEHKVLDNLNDIENCIFALIVQNQYDLEDFKDIKDIIELKIQNVALKDFLSLVYNMISSTDVKFKNIDLRGIVNKLNMISYEDLEQFNIQQSIGSGVSDKDKFRINVSEYLRFLIATHSLCTMKMEYDSIIKQNSTIDQKIMNLYSEKVNNEINLINSIIKSLN